jgi:hypothetical protein
MILVAVPTRLSLAVQPFGDAVGDPVAAESQDIFKMPRK